MSRRPINCEYLDLDAVVTATKAEVLSLHKKTFSAVGTDTRGDLTDQLFIALRGDNFDAHSFVDQAVEQGATILLLDQKDIAKAWSDQVTCLLVADTLKALQNLAHYWRKELKATVVGITGSNGKTTTKEFLATIVKQSFQVTASRGSFNNHWGVPLTLLSCQKSDDVVILEMGMNHLGELTELCRIGEPDITLVTNVGCSHIGEVGSIEKVAQAKEEIYKESPHSQGIFNLDNEYTLEMFKSFQGTKRFSFSEFKKESTVSLRATQMGIDFIQVEGRIDSVEGSVKIPVFGKHNVTNAMSAATVAVALGISPKTIWAALKACQSTWGRNQLVELKSGAKVLFDAYNSNPESLTALIQNLCELDREDREDKENREKESRLIREDKENREKESRLILVIGQMLELGEESAQKHREMGHRMAALGPDILWFIGEDWRAFQSGLEAAQFRKISYFSDIYEQSLALSLGSMLNSRDMVVIKGSRGIKLERVLQDWNPINF